LPKILVFQHVASEPLGHLDPLLRNSGCRIKYVNFERDPGAQPDVRRYDGLVVLGGPMNVDQADRFPHLETEKQLIREAVLAGVTGEFQRLLGGGRASEGETKSGRDLRLRLAREFRDTRREVIRHGNGQIVVPQRECLEGVESLVAPVHGH